MNSIYNRLERCYEIIEKKMTMQPKVALVLGSGLGDYADHIQIKQTIDYSEIQGFPVSTVPGHKGRFVFGYIGDVPAVIMQGRVHYYEGYSMEDVVLPIRLMKMMGADILFLTNAAGGIGDGYQAGDFMMLTDHISSFVPSPLIGANVDQLGERFPDMSHVYDEDLQQIIEGAAKDCGINLQKGVYVQMTGPNFESPAEIRMCKTLGASAVGMSTVCEAIAANHMGMKICGISCISNMAAGLGTNALTHEEVQESADKVAPLFRKLVTESIERMGKELL